MLETTSLSPHLGVGGHNQNISLNIIDYLYYQKQNNQTNLISSVKSAYSVCQTK